MIAGDMHIMLACVSCLIPDSVKGGLAPIASDDESNAYMRATWCVGIAFIRHLIVPALSWRFTFLVPVIIGLPRLRFGLVLFASLRTIYGQRLNLVGLCVRRSRI